MWLPRMDSNHDKVIQSHFERQERRITNRFLPNYFNFLVSFETVQVDTV